MKVRRQPGFTLIEVLIAMTLIGLIVTLLFNGLRLAGRAGESVATEADRVHTVLAVQRALRARLEQARPYRLRDVAGEVTLAFYGAPDRLRFIAPLPSRLGPGGLYWIELHAAHESAAESAPLMLEYWPFDPGLKPAGAGSPHRQKVLLADVEFVRFRYLGDDSATDGQWLRNWQDRRTLPTAIRLEVAVANDRHIWPELVVNPRLAVAAADLAGT